MAGPFAVVCQGKFCTLISDAGDLDRALSRNLGMNVLSNEFKVLAAIMSEDRCVIKDLPSLTGLSNRTVYDIVAHLQGAGVLSKSRDTEDRRFHLVDLEFDNFKKRICDSVAQSTKSEFGCDFRASER